MPIQADNLQSYIQIPDRQTVYVDGRIDNPDTRTVYVKGQSGSLDTQFMWMARLKYCLDIETVYVASTAVSSIYKAGLHRNANVNAAYENNAYIYVGKFVHCSAFAEAANRSCSQAVRKPVIAECKKK